jgi:hypothetical protein
MMLMRGAYDFGKIQLMKLFKRPMMLMRGAYDIE